MPRKRVLTRRRLYVIDGDFPNCLNRFKEASGLEWAEMARLLGTSAVNLWRWRFRGVKPNASHLLALQDLADDLDLGHLLPAARVRPRP